jgi:glutaredoxin
MTQKPRTVEIFSAGCALCEETIAMVRRLACDSCEVRILDMRQPEVAVKARQHGIRSVPAVVIDGKLAECCANRGVDEMVLLRAGLGETRQA